MTPVGIGIILAAAAEPATGTACSRAVFAVCFVWALAVILRAQKKYNGGLFKEAEAPGGASRGLS